MEKIVEYKFSDATGALLGLSLVSEPAVESNFLCFSKKKELFFNDEKKIVTGCALRANYVIPRYGYSIVFSEKEIEKLVFASMKKGFPTTLNHEGKTDGAFLVESFFLRNEDERFPGVDTGSWMVSYKIEDEKIWKAAKSGMLKGFSVEVMVDLPTENFSKKIPFLF